MHLNLATTGIRQIARRVNAIDRGEEVIDSLNELLPVCGEGSKNKQMAYRIGRTLLSAGNTPVILVPCCPDYTHESGLYTFRGIRSGMPLLARLHLTFLRSVLPTLPNAKAIMLMADQEADDALLVRACGVSRDTFSQCIQESIHTTRQAVAGLPIEVHAMSDLLPTLRDEEHSVAEWLTSETRFASRITAETCQRAKMYRKIAHGLTWEDMIARTVRTAAQYLVLGRYANEHNMLICNHTTTNLSWYKETEVGVLHNPVQVY